MNWYFEVLKKYAVFEGRARRKEYWMFTLINLIIMFALAFAGVALLGNDGAIIANIYSLAVMIPNIAVGVRRMHDTDHSGWWILLPIVNLVFAVQDSQPESNRFGPNPKESPVVRRNEVPSHNQGLGNITPRYEPTPQLTPAPIPPQQAFYRLVPQRSDLGLPTLALPVPGNYRLGRTQSATVQLAVQNQNASSEHLLITVNPDYSVVVEDLDSMNGTQVAGMALARGQLQPLQVGQTLRLGHADVTYTLQRG